MAKILIADTNEEFLCAMYELLCRQNAVQTCANGVRTLELLESFQPDILVLDLMLPGTDGISILQKLPRGSRPLILATTAFCSPYVVAQMRKLEVHYLMQKPCATEAAEARVQDFLALLSEEPLQAPEAEQSLPAMLLKLGFSPKLDGYRYLLTAIPLYAEDPGQSLTKELYGKVGRPWNKAPCHVERSIRSAIEKAWQFHDDEIWGEIFPHAPDGSVPMPTNGTLIARLSEFLTNHGRITRVG